MLNLTPRVQQVWQTVADLYVKTGRPEAVYLWNNHVRTVAKFTADLSDRFGGNKDLVIVGALLHDIADAWFERDDEKFDGKMKTTIKSVLLNSDFGKDELHFVQNEIIKFH